MATKKLAGSAPVASLVTVEATLVERPRSDLVHDVAHAAAVRPLLATSPTAEPAQVAPVLALAAPQTTAPAQAIVTMPVAVTRQSATAVMEKTMKSAEELVSFSQGNVEALMKCGQIWATGMQDLSKSFAATAQAQLDQTVSTWKALAGVKSIKEAMDLQTSLARSSVEAAVAETGKLTDASMKLAEQTMAPITARVTLAVEKFSRIA